MAKTVPVEVTIHHNNARLYVALERSTRRLSAVLMELPLEMRKYVNADIRDNLEALAAEPRNCDKYGNAAAMRDALLEALEYCESDQKSGIAYSDNDVLVPMLRAALTAPARNCDVVRDKNEALNMCRANVPVERDAAYDRGMQDAIDWLLGERKEPNHE